MSHHAAKSAAQPNSSLNTPTVVSVSCYPRKVGCSKPSFYGDFAGRDMAAVEANLSRQGTEDDLVHLGAFRLVSRPLLGVTLRGQNRRPAARRRSASTTSPLRGLGSSQKKFESRSNERCTNFFRAPPRKHSLALGSRAHSLGFA
jgi:hypothetical protein